MKTLRATNHDKDKRDKVYDLDALRRQDQEQGREHLTGDEIEAFIAMGVGRQLVFDAGDRLERFAKERGFLRYLKSAEGLLRRCMITARDAMSGEQLVMISNNINDTDIYLSSRPDLDHPKQMINVDSVQLVNIINQASRVCSLTCSCTREESKMCMLRRSFDTMPGIRKIAKASAVTLGDACPYQAFELDGEKWMR